MCRPFDNLVIRPSPQPPFVNWDQLSIAGRDKKVTKRKTYHIHDVRSTQIRQRVFEDSENTFEQQEELNKQTDA